MARLSNKSPRVTRPAWMEHYQLANLASVPGCLTAVAGWQHQQWLLRQAPGQPGSGEDTQLRHLPSETGDTKTAWFAHDNAIRETGAPFTAVPLAEKISPLNENQAYDERVAQLRQHLGATLIPTTFVMLQRRVPVGSVSLVIYKKSDAAANQGVFNPGVSPSDPGPDVWLTNMFVLPEHRRQGLAQVLLERAEDYARSIQIPRLHLYAQAAADFYLKRRWHLVRQVELQGSEVKILARYLA